MNNLIINRLKFKIKEEFIDVYVRGDESLFYRKNADFFVKKLQYSASEEKANIEDLLPKNYSEKNVKLSYDFNFTEGAHKMSVKIDNIFHIKKSFIKTALINFFKKDFLVEPFCTGRDLSIYKKVASYNSDWDKYYKFDIVILSSEEEISISLGSTDTLISSHEQEIKNEPEVKKAFFINEGFILKIDKTEEKVGKIIANRETRKRIGIVNKIKRKFYEENYNILNNLYEELLSDDIDALWIESGGFKSVESFNLGAVDFENNKMLFGHGHENVNPASGIREGGVYKVPREKAQRIKFIFIFQTSDHANNLYIGLKKGLKHFPGLLSYAGIPVNIADERLQYKSISKLKEEFNHFYEEDLKDKSYEDHVALIILPFNKETATKQESDTYYYLKEKLLEKGIASQFINSDNINSASFHYHLPNIAIAILAKIGGVPWKLKRKDYNELIVGFNEEKVDDISVIGSAVYYDNSGELKHVNSFPKTTSRNSLIVSLKDAIREFLNADNDRKLERLIIHYYKRPKENDMEEIHRLIQQEFRFNIPFALVEINDSKIKTDLCFDIGYKYGMPTSGTYVRLKKGGSEYLLFNNLRYWEKPVRPITQEEYPLKIKIYNADKGGFTHKELISQVYEFSRLYWKGLKQKSQPVTTQYSKMIADFAINFENSIIPVNDTSQQTAWFI